MRPHGHYKVDPSNPRAKAVCDRCGFWYQLSTLAWQYEWTGPRLQNLRVYVCESCLDKPQINIKTFIYPADPVPVLNPRVEQFTLDDSPLSAIGASPNFSQPTFGSRIGSLTGGGGLNAAFDGVVLKPSWISAAGLTSTITSSYAAYVGINWQGEAQPNLSFPSSLQSPIITHSLSSVSVYANVDRGFPAFVVQSSPTNTAVFGAWTTITTGSAGGAGQSVGITITSTMTNSLSQFHRVAFQGDGTNYVSVSQVQFSVNEVGGQGEQ